MQNKADTYRQDFETQSTVHCPLYQEKQQDSVTRGHSLKLVNNRYHYDLRKFSFAPRIVNVWNSLPEIEISADTTGTFKRRLDEFWQHHMIIRLS